MAKLVIKNHRPWQMAVAIISLSMVLSLITWLLLDTNHWQSIYRQLSGNSSARQLIEENQLLIAENEELKGKILMLEQTTRLDQETAIQMQNDIRLLQDEIYDLKRELEFYKGIMVTSKQVSGFDIHGIFINPLSKINNYNVKIVLTNVAKSDRLIEGTLDFTIDGTENNRKQSLKLSKIITDGSSDLSFQLKNFRQVEVNIQLPAEFEPDRIWVIANINKANTPPVSRYYDW